MLDTDVHTLGEDLALVDFVDNDPDSMRGDIAADIPK